MPADDDLDSFFFDSQSEPVYAHVILVIDGHAPLLAGRRYARLASDTLDACAALAPGRLWGYVVLPDSVRLVVGPCEIEALDTFVDQVKERIAGRLLEVIQYGDDGIIDHVLRYSPVWGGVIYRVWQMGYHSQVFWTEYKLDNALHALRNAPLEAGLVEPPEVWPYLRLGDETD